MIRAAVLFACLASPALAWEYAHGHPCTLTLETNSVAVKLTYDPTQPLYSIAVTRPHAFTPATTFAMRFQGPMPISIATDRHQMRAEGKTIYVEDSGFGNVLNGLQFNHTAFAFLGDQRIEIPLTGAAEEIAAFRLCAPEAGT